VRALVRAAAPANVRRGSMDRMHSTAGRSAVADG
jgi:hypothetical protein